MKSLYETTTDRLIAFALPYALALMYAADEHFGFDRDSGVPQLIERFSAGEMDAYLLAVGVNFVLVHGIYCGVTIALRAVR